MPSALLFILGVCGFAVLAIAMCGPVIDSKNGLIGLIVAIVIVLTVGITSAVNYNNSKKAVEKAAKETIHEIEDEYSVDFKSRDFEDKVLDLTAHKPEADTSSNLNGIVYTHEDQTYTTDLILVYSIDDRDRSSISLYSASGAESLTPFSPASGELANAVTTQSKEG